MLWILFIGLMLLGTIMYTDECDETFSATLMVLGFLGLLTLSLIRAYQMWGWM